MIKISNSSTTTNHPAYDSTHPCAASQPVIMPPPPPSHSSFPSTFHASSNRGNDDTRLHAAYLHQGGGGGGGGGGRGGGDGEGGAARHEQGARARGRLSNLQTFTGRRVEGPNLPPGVSLVLQGGLETVGQILFLDGTYLVVVMMANRKADSVLYYRYTTTLYTLCYVARLVQPIEQ